MGSFDCETAILVAWCTHLHSLTKWGKTECKLYVKLFIIHANVILLLQLMLTDNLPQLRGLEDKMNEDREKNEKSRAKTKYVGEEEPLLTTD